MNGAIENLNSGNRNWSKIGKNVDRQVSDTQEHLGETLEQKKYKEQTINYWLNEVFWLDPRIQKRLLKAKVDFNKRVSIFGLFKVINESDTNINLGRERLIYLADQCLNEEYMGIFLDYIEKDKDSQTFKKLSVEDFLKLLSSFEKDERPQTLREWVMERLKFDQYDGFFAYCNGLDGEEQKGEDDVVSRSKFEELKAGFESNQSKY